MARRKTADMTDIFARTDAQEHKGTDAQEHTPAKRGRQEQEPGGTADARSPGLVRSTYMLAREHRLALRREQLRREAERGELVDLSALVREALDAWIEGLK